MVSASTRSDAAQGRSAPGSPPAAARRCSVRPVSTSVHAGSGSHAPTAQALDQIGFVALEARSRWGSHFQHPILDADARPDLAAARTLPLFASFSRIGGLVHAAGFDVGAALSSPFRRAISSRCSATVRSSSVNLANRRDTSSRSWADDRPSRSTGEFTHSLNLTAPSRRKRKMQPRPGFCPCYIKRRFSHRLVIVQSTMLSTSPAPAPTPDRNTESSVRISVPRSDPAAIGGWIRMWITPGRL